jgi:hypothetical protein
MTAKRADGVQMSSSITRVPTTFARLWKTCGRSVNILCTERHEQVFLIKDRINPRDGGQPFVFVCCFVLIAARQCARMLRSTDEQISASRLLANVVHRFEHSIAGRPYLIEAASVSPDRWRAYIVRVNGVPTALMPFYGRTPYEAAGLLTDWLSRAHQRAAK